MADRNPPNSDSDFDSDDDVSGQRFTHGLKDALPRDRKAIAVSNSYDLDSDDSDFDSMDENDNDNGTGYPLRSLAITRDHGADSDSDFDSDVQKGEEDSDFSSDGDGVPTNATPYRTPQPSTRPATTNTRPSPAAVHAPPTSSSGMCIVCNKRAIPSQAFCTLTCKERWEARQRVDQSSTAQTAPRDLPTKSQGKVGKGSASKRRGSAKHGMCVICDKKPVYPSPGVPPFVTCGTTCLENLCDGDVDSTKCDYCHRRPKMSGSSQCGKECATNAKQACLMCRARPKLPGKVHFCGNACREIALKATPRLCEVPKEHVTWEMVERKFKEGWKDSITPCPTLLRVYKIVENDEFHAAYTQYKNQVGNEHFLYHGTTRRCQLGEGSSTVCASTTCAACNILKTSYDVTFSRASGAFGAGIYCSSAVNKAEVYTGRVGGATGAMFLNKMAIGREYKVKGFREVTALPNGYNSVVFDNDGGRKNETIIYDNNAIRPVFFLIF